MRITALALTLGLAAFATSASAQTVAYDYDKGTDFTRLKSYSWVPGANLDDEINHQRIIAAVDSELVARGMTRVDPGSGPDMLITYHVAFAQDLEVRGYSSDWGGMRRSASRSGSARTERVLLGMLAVQMVNPVTGATVWRASARREVDLTASPEEREKNIAKAADKLFKHYPVKR